MKLAFAKVLRLKCAVQTIEGERRVEVYDVVTQNMTSPEDVAAWLEKSLLSNKLKNATVFEISTIGIGDVQGPLYIVFE
jgi:hypothetical protein